MKQVYCAKTFAERCRAVRLEKDLRQKKVAKAIGWNRTSLSKFENGRFREKMDFPASRLGHLMDVLEVSADYLLFGDEHKKKLLDRFNKASYENFELAKKEFPRTSFHEEYACEDISQRLKRIRAEHGLSQQELASRLGYRDKSTVCRLENCLREVKTEHVVRYADHFQISADYLITGRIGYIISLFDKSLRELSYPNQLKFVAKAIQLMELKKSKKII